MLIFLLLENKYPMGFQWVSNWYLSNDYKSEIGKGSSFFKRHFFMCLSLIVILVTLFYWFEHLLDSFQKCFFAFFEKIVLILLVIVSYKNLDVRCFLYYSKMVFQLEMLVIFYTLDLSNFMTTHILLFLLTL